MLNRAARARVNRALFELINWDRLKWLDAPCPFYDWQDNQLDKQPE
ncbi:hypothetical protein [Mycobacterium leprae]